MKRFISLNTIILLFSLIFVACNKDDEDATTLPADIKTVAQIGRVLDQSLLDFQSMANQATNTNLKSAISQDGTVIPSKSNIVVDIDTTHITINFGSAGTLCGDGRFRKGIVFIVASDRPSMATIGSTVTISTQNYEVDGYQIDFTKVVTFNGTGSSDVYPYGYLDFSVSVQDGRIINPIGDTAYVVVDHTRKLLAGEIPFTTVGWAVNGNSSVVVKPGPQSVGYFKEFTDAIEITKDVVKPLWFRYLISGEVVHTLSTGKVITVNFGDGNVYDLTTWRGRQTITSNGVSEEISQN